MLFRRYFRLAASGAIIFGAISLWGMTLEKSGSKGGSSRKAITRTDDSPHEAADIPSPQSFNGGSAPPADRKTGLEVQKLEYDLGTGKLLEWVKAVGPLFTGLGIAVTLWLGVAQLKQTQQSRDDERFERSASRLGSEQPAERLTGLAGLQQFLKSKNPEKQESSLIFIVNAISIEKDDTVRDALIDSLVRLDRNFVQKNAINSALVAARDRNRAVFSRLRNSFWNNLKAGEPWPSSPRFTEVPIGDPSDAERAPLEASAKAIAALVRAGAYERDLSQVYCVECKFSTAEQPAYLENVSFDGAFLRRARFDNAKLAGASFRNADLVSTFFTSADLLGAKITADVPATPWQELAGMSSGTTLAIHGADFSCANLTSADFSGRAVFTIMYENPVIGLQGDNFARADLTQAKLDSFQILLGFPRDFVDANGGKESFDFRKYFPIVTGQWTGFGDPIPSIKGSSDYYLLTVSTNSNFKIDGTLDTRAFWDFVIQLRNLHGARNLDGAILSPGLRNFIDVNRALISPSLGEPRC